MAKGKLLDLSTENQELIDEVLQEVNIPQWVIVKGLCNNKMKDVYRISKSSDVVEKISNGVNFILIINEEIFDELIDEQQKMLIHEAIAGITYDPDKDTIGYNTYDFATYSGILQKYGDSEVIKLKESVKSLFDAKKEREEQEKEAKKKSKNNDN